MFRFLHLLDSALALCRAVSYTFCSPSAICLSSIAPISMKIQLPLVFRISPWQRLLFECSATCTFLIQLLRFAKLSPLPFCSPSAICLSSIAPILTKIQLLLVFRIVPWQRPLFDCSAACTFLIQLLRFAELSPIPFCSPSAICLSSIAPIFDEDSAVAGFSNCTMAEATLCVFRCQHLLDSALAL